ncbi:MAG: A/G-specific adenine glycosylase, partial [Anaerolineaceae bacterium]|nr:A/G-specific adenine glycosylase [Anaerolineaceae bacterium]
MGEFTRRLLAWYARSARSLPWRGHPDPYAVWVSEIMLQQTRVETVIPYFHRWMERFPTIRDLAKAPLQEVLRTWEGLGYYSRARNLWRAAQEVEQKYAGQIPSQRDALQALPGIGRYSAGAIASIVFGQDEPALDGNIRRVLARVFNVDLPARSPNGEARLWGLARENLPPGRAGDYNQAIMDLGSAICTPHAPACLICPVMEVCQARELGIQEQRPVLAAKPAIPHYTVTAAILQRADAEHLGCRTGPFLITRRPAEGLLGGMWEFPGGKQQEGEDLPACLRREILEELGVQIEVGEPIGVYRHAYTHFKVTLHAFCCRLVEGNPQPLEASALAWVSPGELGAYPMG